MALQFQQEQYSIPLHLFESMVQLQKLPRSRCNNGLTHKAPIQYIVDFSVSSMQLLSNKIGVTAVVIPRVSCHILYLSDMPLSLEF